MASILSIAEIAFLIGDPARANMLFALRDSGTASAGDLTRAGNVAPSTASEHLAKLTAAGLVAVSKVGRTRYYRLADPGVADVLDGIDALAGKVAPDGPPGLRGDQAALHARPCGDHLAGRVGVALTEAWLARGYLRRARGGMTTSPAGDAAFGELGVDIARLHAEPRRLIVMCNDWSEGAVHLGGSLGGALLRVFVARDWLRRTRGAAHVGITPGGRAAFRERFGVDLRAGA